MQDNDRLETGMPDFDALKSDISSADAASADPLLFMFMIALLAVVLFILWRRRK